jgi:hypothetical protein
MRISGSVWKAVGAVVLALCLYFVAAPCVAQAYRPIPEGSDVDPARVAHQVFEDPGFWWKRIEPPRPMWVSLSWLLSLIEELMKAIGQTLGKILEAIAKFLARLFGALGGTASDVTTGIVLIVVGLLAWSVYKLYPVVARWLFAGRTSRLTQESQNWQSLAESADLFEQAGQAMRDGRHADAIRLALLTLIARLEKLGLLRYDTTRTNREYQRELRHRADLSASFGQLARIYDRVWYGRSPAYPADAEQAISLCQSLINREDLAPE